MKGGGATGAVGSRGTGGGATGAVGSRIDRRLDGVVC